MDVPDVSIKFASGESSNETSNPPLDQASDKPMDIEVSDVSLTVGSEESQISSGLNGSNKR